MERRSQDTSMTQPAGGDATAGTYHVPVLLEECLEGLAIRPDGVYVDVTYGGGGHSREILGRLGEGGRLYGFDQDPDAAVEVVEEVSQGGSLTSPNLLPLGNSSPLDSSRLPAGFTFVASNFRYLRNWMRYYGELDSEGERPLVDGILADLGVSSHHLDDESRGFSFRFDSPIDMRMNKRSGQTAADILNNYSEERLADVLYNYGEVKQSRRLAALIEKTRRDTPYRTTGDLVATCEQCLPRERSKKELAKVFQALRIEVNHEMDALREMLEASVSVLKPGGRLVVITYHSLEDRMVKNFLRTGNIEGKVRQDLFGRVESPFRLVNKKPILPTEEELRRNPRSRSAKLRCAQRSEKPPRLPERGE